MRQRLLRELEKKREVREGGERRRRDNIEKGRSEEGE